MNTLWNATLEAVCQHWLLEKLFFASVEFTVLALAIGLVILLGRIRHPRLLALLWLLVLVKPLVSLCFGSFLPTLRLPPAPVPTFVEVIETVAESATAQPQEAEVSMTTQIPAWRIVLALWTMGAAAFALLAVRDQWRLRRILQVAAPPDEGLMKRLQAAAQRHSLRRVPELRVTDRFDSPALAGIWRSVIIFPRWLGESGHETAQEWALAHELTHARLRDPLAIALRQITRILFYFHPLTWWVGARWERAMEMACDRALVATRDDAEQYAGQLFKMLIQVRGRRRRLCSQSLYASRSQISRRIEFLLTRSWQGAAALSRSGVTLLVLLTVAALSIGCRTRMREMEKSEKSGVNSQASASATGPNLSFLNIENVQADNISMSNQDAITMKGRARIRFRPRNAHADTIDAYEISADELSVKRLENGNTQLVATSDSPKDQPVIMYSPNDNKEFRDQAFLEKSKALGIPKGRKITKAKKITIIANPMDVLDIQIKPITGESTPKPTVVAREISSLDVLRKDFDSTNTKILSADRVYKNADGSYTLEGHAAIARKVEDGWIRTVGDIITISMKQEGNAHTMSLRINSFPGGGEPTIDKVREEKLLDGLTHFPQFAFKRE